MGIPIEEGFSQILIKRYNMKTPKRIELSPYEMQELIKRIKEHKLTEGDYETIEGMLVKNLSTLLEGRVSG